MTKKRIIWDDKKYILLKQLMQKKYPYSYIAKALNINRPYVQQKIKSIDPNYKVKTHIDLNDPETKKLVNNLSLSNLQIRRIAYRIYNKKEDNDIIEKEEGLAEGTIDILIEFFNQHLHKTFILEEKEIEYFACLLYVGYTKTKLMREYYLTNFNMDSIVEKLKTINDDIVIKNGLEVELYMHNYIKNTDKYIAQCRRKLCNIDKMTRICVLDEMIWYYKVVGQPEMEEVVIMFVYFNWNNPFIWKSNRDTTLKEWDSIIKNWQKSRRPLSCQTK